MRESGAAAHLCGSGSSDNCWLWLPPVGSAGPVSSTEVGWLRRGLPHSHPAFRILAHPHLASGVLGLASKPAHGPSDGKRDHCNTFSGEASGRPQKQEVVVNARRSCGWSLDVLEVLRPPGHMSAGQSNRPSCSDVSVVTMSPGWSGFADFLQLDPC